MPLPASSRVRRAALLAAGVAAVVLAACGGGGGTDAGDSAPLAVTPTAFTQGTITGLGSIVVNGVRFDDSAATVTDDADERSTAQHLRLGMRVAVDHASVDSRAATARAVAVRFGSLVRGPVASVDAAGNTLTVLGQVVDVTANTVFSDTLAAGLSAVAAGAVVEVHGLADAATGRITATRVEAAGSATRYKLRGTVAGLNTSAMTFTIGAAAISYAGVPLTAVVGALANGMTVRVMLDTTQRGGQWVATALGIQGAGSDRASGLGGHVRGKITAYTSASSFSVDGLAVDASGASFPDGSGGLALGVEVEVKGAVNNGVLVASVVSLESRHQGEDSRKWHLFGAITAADAAARTFVVRGVTVTHADTTTFTGGTAADLVVGRKVHVKGAVGSTRTQVQATAVGFE